MSYLYYLLLALFVVRGIYYLVRKAKWKSAKDAKSNASLKADDAMEGLRNMALTTTPEQLGLTLSSGSTTVFGVIMDIGMDKGAATITSYQTGDASLYLSTGGGILGGGKNESVSNVAKQFVSLAQKFIDKVTKSDSMELPLSGSVKFYLLTNMGVYVGEDFIKNFENHSSVWTEMFNEGNNVLTALRMSGSVR
jgi:hypothetical protein